MYNFEIYTGQENMYRQMQEENLGASANVIVRLCRIIPRFLNHTVFCDNYFTTVPLILYLQNEGIHCIGTIRRNRIPNPKLKTEREMQKCARGFYEEFSTSFENVAMSLVHWRDKKYVTLISSYCGALPTSTVKRWDNKNKKSIIIQRPAIIKEYNRHMGGVDLHDSFIGRYRIKLKSSKWYLRMFFHFLDVAVVNSWIIYRQLCASRKIASMSLNQFRKDVAKGLCLVGSYVKPSTSSSSKRLNQALMKKTRKKSAQNIPIKDIRVDKVGHFPIWDKRTRCKLPSCKEQSFIKCTKCQVSLCLNSSRNCFLEFHQ